MHITSDHALNRLKLSQKPFLELFKHGTLSIEIYKPDETDHQKPHDKDEVYIIISGNGKFINGDEIVEFGAGDFLFVPAGVHHRFIEFSNDFSTWVIFYGPIAGEIN
ncbi:MAG: cupin domain-containing protein [Saprospiraceae bacterium]